MATASTTELALPSLYPNGDNIDQFCRCNGDTANRSPTWRKPFPGCGCSPSQRGVLPIRTAVIADVCITHGVEFQRGLLQARWRPDEDLASVFNWVRAGWRCLVAYLWFTLQLSRRRIRRITVANEVEEYLAESRLEYDMRQKAGRTLVASLGHWTFR